MCGLIRRLRRKNILKVEEELIWIYMKVVRVEMTAVGLKKEVVRLKRLQGLT